MLIYMEKFEYNKYYDEVKYIKYVLLFFNYML